MDRVVETTDGFDCIVEGRRFGTWATRPLARAGMKVEQERAHAHRWCETNKELWCHKTPDEILMDIRDWKECVKNL